jgi:hypothetical protein
MQRKRDAAFGSAEHVTRQVPDAERQRNENVAVKNDRELLETSEMSHAE